MRLYVVVVVLLLCVALHAGCIHAQLNGAGDDLAATESSPNESFDLGMLSDEELMAELERRKAALEQKESQEVVESIIAPANETIAMLEQDESEDESVSETTMQSVNYEEPPMTQGTSGPVEDFVQIYDGEFVVVREADDASGSAMCEPFYLTGWNSWDVTRVPRLQSYRSMSGQEALRQQLKTASESGFNVIRAWGHTIDSRFPVLASPGQYDESGLRAIDFLLSEASKNGIRVILSFVDNWKYPGGVDQMIDWSETAPEREIPLPASLLEGGDYNQDGLPEEVKEYIVKRHSLFYTDEGARSIYRDYVETLVNRKNHYNGRIYRDDPTILAWNLINEPRCESWLVGDCEEKLQSWIESESAFVKQLDPNHLVTVGEEGFWASDSEYEFANPTWWAKKMGQNFKLNHMPDSIDFATIHIWPDTWSRPEESFQKAWILEHMRQAEEELGKPLILEEFGKSLEAGDDIARRDQVYRSVQETVEDSAREGHALKGSLFWNWEVPLLQSPGTYEINEGDSTFNLVRDHARKMSEIGAGKKAFPCGSTRTVSAFSGP